MNTIKNFLKDESGLELSEYAVAAALVIIGAAAVFTNLAGAITAAITKVINQINPS